MLNGEGKTTKHGGSPESGLVAPGGLEDLKTATPDGMVLVPRVVVDAEKQAAERKERALQLERRRISLEIVKGLAGSGGASPETIKADVELSLKYANELIDQTGGGI